MQLFLFLNDLAGRWPWVDELFRAVYVGTVPLLGTLLLARLTLFPKAPDDPPRSRVVLATILAAALSVLTMLAINAFARALHLGVLSPRPFMTRRVNLLIVEPQDNSFPAPELMVAAVFVVALALSGRRWAVPGIVLTLLLSVARLYCGSNYMVDVIAGALIGTAWAGLTLSLVHVPLRNVARTMQMSWSGALLGATLLSVYVGLAFQPRFATKLYLPWATPATAAPVEGKNPPAIKSARDARGALQEGEGVAEGEGTEDEAEALALSKRSSLFLPQVEAFMRGRLAPRTKPFTLLDVEVAPVKAGSSAYRCAAVRFEIQQNVPNLRRQVAECAARLVKMSFALDSRLQNVDIIAILRGDGKTIDGSDMTFIGDEVPVFTASIQRKNLVLKSPAWANSPTIDGGSWLRFRSRLFVNDKVMPVSTEHRNEPIPQPSTPTPQLPLAAGPLVSATPLRPTVTPTTPRPKATATVAPLEPTPKPSVAPAVPNLTAPRPVPPRTSARVAAPKFGAHQALSSVTAPTAVAAPHVTPMAHPTPTAHPQIGGLARP